MVVARTPCPECGQDWVHPYRFTDDGSRFYLCTECDSLWWPDQSIGVDRPAPVDEVVAERLNIIGNPWVDRVWADVMEPAPKTN
ncbi:hypothetical protein [Actinoplanes couchii]|uniref:Uncharacterized protein n=1 Tax=Actinoplanes couchii TaxID=403638 RepID=A0ABQ3XDG8_9ACTN|nr:hypothetical protein [Actinoplanes couchii]MDR6317045.1 hypothetical protein [Actinoplanes couchii]GID56541.1 hypothetical protein Aco03nite_049450 [Actinoplanes couchii]